MSRPFSRRIGVGSVDSPIVKDPGETRPICPGKVGKLQLVLCPLSAFYSDDVTTVENPPEMATAPKWCTQKFATVPGAALDKFRQKPCWGSEEWWLSYNRRTHAEGIFGNLRNPDTQSIKRGFCREYGLVKTSLMLTFWAMAANIRLLREWSKRTGDIADLLSEPYPEHHGHEEIDEFGQVILDDGSGYEDPPDNSSA